MAGRSIASRFERIAESFGRHRGVRHDAELDLGTAVHLLRHQVDLRQTYAVGEARRAAEAEDPVEAAAHHQDDVGPAQRRGARSIHEVRMVVGNRSAAHR
jgi:hypothetical protein